MCGGEVEDIRFNIGVFICGGGKYFCVRHAAKLNTEYYLVFANHSMIPFENQEHLMLGQD